MEWCRVLKLTDWYSLRIRVRMLDPQIVQAEHLAEGLYRDVNQRGSGEQRPESKVVSGIALSPEALRCFKQAAWLSTQPGLATLVMALGSRHGDESDVV